MNEWHGNIRRTSTRAKIVIFKSFYFQDYREVLKTTRIVMFYYFSGFKTHYLTNAEAYVLMYNNIYNKSLTNPRPSFQWFLVEIIVQYILKWKFQRLCWSWMFEKKLFWLTWAAFYFFPRVFQSQTNLNPLPEFVLSDAKLIELACDESFTRREM